MLIFLVILRQKSFHKSILPLGARSLKAADVQATLGTPNKRLKSYVLQTKNWRGMAACCTAL